MDTDFSYIFDGKYFGGWSLSLPCTCNTVMFLKMDRLNCDSLAVKCQNFALYSILFIMSTVQVENMYKT